MVNTKMRYKFRPEWFEAYGLDKRKNMLQSPKCDCGCDGKMKILLKDIDAVSDFATTMLFENDCCHCAIFVHCLDGKMYTFMKILDENEEVRIYKTSIDKTEMNFFQLINEDYEFHCYGLLIETNNGEWAIVED